MLHGRAQRQLQSNIFRLLVLFREELGIEELHWFSAANAVRHPRCLPILSVVRCERCRCVVASLHVDTWCAFRDGALYSLLDAAPRESYCVLMVIWIACFLEEVCTK